MQGKKKFMAGNSDFLSLQAGGFYYVDKTLLIRDLLDHPAMVTLITRPRRFGKTLNMSMLQAFFETGSGGKEFFEKLNIWKCGEAYTRHCEAYPVISLSLKDVKGDDWDSMYAQFCTVIRNEVGRLEAKGMLAGAEVRELAEYYGVPERFEEIQDWYDGYRIGDREIYNPWSVINYFADGCRAQAYWSQTSRNAILQSMLRKSDPEMKRELRELLEGKSCEKIISDSVTYDVLDRGAVETAPDDPSVLYTLLVMTGYLKIERVIRTLSTAYVCEVQIPNREIRTLYADEILDSCRKGCFSDRVPVICRGSENVRLQ